MPKKLTEKIAKNYDAGRVVGGLGYGYGFYSWRRIPPFRRYYHVREMMRDSRVRMSLGILKGMVNSLTRVWFNDGESERREPTDVKEYACKQLERFWTVGAVNLLSAMEWGYYGAEVLYRMNSEGQYCFDCFQSFRPQHVKPVLLDGDLVGIEVKGGSGDQKQYIGCRKAFWHVYDRTFAPWYGQSILAAAYEPWLDKHAHGGAIDSRRLYHYKYLFQGTAMYHPPGVDGNGKSHGEHADEMLTKAKNGGVFALPHAVDEHGNRMWEIVDRQSTQNSADCREWVYDLDKEISEGVGVSEELWQAADTGSGFSGRKIPEQAVRGMLTDTVYWMFSDFDTQILRPLIREEFGIVPDYQLVPFGLTRDENEEPYAVDDPQQKVPGAVADKAKQQPTKFAV